MKTFEKINCIICGSNETSRISKYGRHELKANVCLCKKCGLGYLNPRWDKKSYIDFYSNEYDYYYRKNIVRSLNEEGKPLEANTNNINAIVRRLKENNVFPENPSNILDIGAGEGTNLKFLKDNYYPNTSCFAIEQAKDCIKLLEQLDIEIISKDVEADWHHNHYGKFDLIIMRHVLEHFLNPLDVIKKVSPTLSKNGVLYIAVPNSLNPRLPLSTYFFRVAHTYYFNKYSLANLLALSNMEMIFMNDGDEYNSTELFTVAKNSPEVKELNISQQHYVVQETLFRKILPKEKTSKRLIKRYLKRNFPAIMNILKAK